MLHNRIIHCINGTPRFWRLHGFLQYSSTDTCNAKRLAYLDESRNRREHTFCLSLDIHGAFNYIDTELLLDGIQVLPRKIVVSYFIDRSIGSLIGRSPSSVRSLKERLLPLTN